MYHNLHQAQQLLNTIDQMVAQMRQQEASNQQILSQIEQRESQATQKLNQIQQMCQECSRVLQNAAISISNQSFKAMPMQPAFQHEIGSPMGYTGMAYQASGVNLGQQQNVGEFLPTQSPLVDPTTMGASTYYDSLRQFGGQGNQSLYTPGAPASFSGISSFGAQSSIGMGAQSANQGYSRSGISASGVNLGQSQNAGSFLSTQSPLVDPATMGASTYYDSLKQFGAQGNQSLFTPGAAAGMASGSTISSSGQGGVFSAQGISGAMGQGSSAGINMEVSSLPTQTPFASTTTMGPEKYQSAAQKLGGTGMSMSTVGQQSGISTRQ